MIRSWPAHSRRQAGDADYIAIQRLSPHDTQHRLKAQAVALMVELAQFRALLHAQSSPSNAKPLLIVVVAWFVVTFLPLVRVAQRTNTIALTVSALSVSGTIFLILELDGPFGGMIQISSEPMLDALSHLAKYAYDYPDFDVKKW